MKERKKPANEDQSKSREEKLALIAGSFEMLGADALITGDHEYGVSPSSVKNARLQAKELISELFPNVEAGVINEVISRGSQIRGGAFTGNVGLTLNGLAEGSTESDKILLEIFGNSDLLAAFRSDPNLTPIVKRLP